MKRIIIFTAILVSSNVYAGGWTNWAVPTQIDVNQGNGMMVYGSFGNPGQCTVSDRIYIQSTHPDYDRLYSLVLAAFMSGKSIMAYSHTCDAVVWYSAPSTTYNYVTGDGAINIKN